MGHTEHLSTLFFVFFKHLVQNQLSVANAKVVDPYVSGKGGSFFVFFDTFIKLHGYVVIYFWFTYSILSIVFLNAISTDLKSITAKKVSLFFILDWKLFYISTVLLFWTTWSHCMSHNVHTSTLFLTYFFKIWFETNSLMPLQLFLLQL